MLSPDDRKLMSWLTITAHLDEAPLDWSLLIEIFRDHGCENTIQTDDPPTLGAAIVETAVSDKVIDELSKALEKAGAKVEVAPLVEQNWDEIWRSHFKPRRIGRRIVIRPTWEEFDSGPDDVEIVLDPGQAFGTGDHPTTRLCLELLENIQAKRVADVGCGSGILSIAAKKLGAEEVNGVDVEAVSVEVALENAKINQVDCRFVVGDSIGALPPGPYDLILSNIISATLIYMAPKFADSMTSNGAWIASGIIEQNWPVVKSAADQAGFILEELKEEDGWVAAQFRLRVLKAREKNPSP